MKKHTVKDLPPEKWEQIYLNFDELVGLAFMGLNNLAPKVSDNDTQVEIRRILANILHAKNNISRTLEDEFRKLTETPDTHTHKDSV